MSKREKHIEDLTVALRAFGLDLPELNFVVRDALSNTTSVKVHTTDRTPVLFDPDIGDGGSREVCFAGIGLDIGGKSTTGRDGRVTWKLTNYICEAGTLNIDEPVAFVATARAVRPVVITSRTSQVGNDLEIEVFSWEIDGSPAPGTQFSWRCWANNPIIVD